MNSPDDTEKKTEGDRPWLAALKGGPSAEALLREAAAAARREGAALMAVHVEHPRARIAPSSDRVKRLSALAGELGVDFLTITGSNIGLTIAQFAEEKRAGAVIAGKPRRGFVGAVTGGPIRELLAADRPFRVLLVPRAKGAARETRRRRLVSSRRSPLLEYGFALAATALVTVINLLLAPLVGYRSIALFYLLFISFVALFLRVGPVVLAAALSALLWNFMFIPPLHTFSIAHFEDLFMFLVYFVNAVLIGGLTARLRIREQVLQRSEKKIMALYDLSRELGKSLDREDIVRAAVKYLDEYLKGRTAVLLGEPGAEDGRPPPVPGMAAHRASTLALTEDEYGAALQVFKQDRPASPRGGPVPAPRISFIPLRTGAGSIGLLGVKPGAPKDLDLEDENFLRGAASLIALALERDAYMRRSEQARVTAESERLYQTLFNLLSHELRTPLTTIKGAASSLADEAVDGRPETRRALYAEMKKAGDRLNQLFANLLSMSRIDSGFLKLEKRPHDLRDIVSRALGVLSEELTGRRVRVDIPDDLPDCQVDFDFMEQVFVNLLQNAALYAGPAAGIAIRAFGEDGAIAVLVADDGPGWSPADFGRLFEKFKRGAGAPAGGLGLGLSICRGIVEAHGGTITAASGQAGGAEIRIRLPSARGPERDV